MTAAIQLPPVVPVPQVPPLETGPRLHHPDNRKRFTQAEFVRMMELGLLEGQRLELIDGDLIDKMGQNPPHAMAIQLAPSYCSPSR